MNKKRLIHGFAAFYVAFALLSAHSAVVSNQVLAVSSSYKEAVVAASERLVQDHQRLDLTNSQAHIYDDSYFDGIVVRPANKRAEYTVRIWTGDFCGGCKTYKAEQVPTLLKLGYKVEYKDYFKDNPPDDVTALPTVQLIHKGKIIHSEINWAAKSVEEFVVRRSALKE